MIFSLAVLLGLVNFHARAGTTSNGGASDESVPENAEINEEDFDEAAWKHLDLGDGEGIQLDELGFGDDDLDLLQDEEDVVVGREQTTSTSKTKRSAEDAAAFIAQFLQTGVTVPGHDLETILNPQVYDRSGLIWSKHDFLSDDFQLNITMSMSGSDQFADGQGWAMWLTTEDFASNYHIEDFVKDRDTSKWHENMKQAGLDLYGWRNQFNGIGIVFDKTTYGMPRVYCLQNDGTKQFDVTEMQKRSNKIPSHPYVFLKPSDVDALSVVMRRGKVKVLVRDQGVMRSVCILKEAEKDLSRLFTGFSTYTGVAPSDPSKADQKPVKVVLQTLSMQTYDTHHEPTSASASSSTSADPAVTAAGTADSTLKDIIGVETERADTVGSSRAHLAMLTRGMEKLITEKKKNSPIHALAEVAARVEELEKFGKSIVEMVRIAYQSTQVGAVHDIKKKMSQVKSVLHIHRLQHEEGMRVLSQGAKKVNDFHDSVKVGNTPNVVTQQYITSAREASNRTFYAIGFFGLLVVFWTLVFNIRMNAIENKKHLV